MFENMSCEHYGRMIKIDEDRVIGGNIFSISIINVTTGQKLFESKDKVILTRNRPLALLSDKQTVLLSEDDGFAFLNVDTGDYKKYDYNEDSTSFLVLYPLKDNMILTCTDFGNPIIWKYQL